ncbi:Glycoside hydrolase superfamily [Acididesulfobacillus acetoxydans]|uniref:Beta-galactosidase/beta-glucuronidase n=1 Tax=Acididesulfobacillus acetoxydans TaxID=1561005 RepID=A0A8S0Y4G2_9FIRM|nr:glycosyl hydrolase [Acididesulfobacillus acetoxydans]CAA7602915.1 Glycoside hydrolase superfamily [Acididesulfobacillus acetoxydans]CEJ05797.1 Beta-galactosidase/beta-glucuronidase [Acididesulfobacillus acetoxydans]
MFNRRAAIILVLLVLSLSVLFVSWQSSLGQGLPAGRDMVSSQRWRISLEGGWEKFASLGAAWTTETGVRPAKSEFAFLNREAPFYLPSETEFAVAVRKFRIPNEWSARTMQLVLGGVNGRVRVYLNGIDSAHQVGEFEGLGGTTRVAIPAGAFRYGMDNVLILQLSAGVGQRSVLFGSGWPTAGTITGELALEAVTETSLGKPRVTAAWQGSNAQVTVQAEIRHHGLMEEGPWTVSAVLSDGSAGVARASQVVRPGPGERESVTFHLAVSGARPWSPKSPFLYQLHLTVANPAGDQDDLAFPLGLRSLGLAGGKFLLNGQPLAIHGVALDPAEEREIRRTGRIAAFLREERRQGVNLLYFVGPVPDPLWLQAADQAGMGVWAEWPVALTPAARLPNPGIFSKLAEDYHPSLWAWTVGKALDPAAPLAGYFSLAKQAAAPNLAFVVRANPRPLWGVPVDQSPVIEGGNLQGPWGKVVPLAAVAGKEASRLPGAQGQGSNGDKAWPGRRFAFGWGLLILYVTLMDLRSATWLYKEIDEKKPKRRLRRAWFWQGLSVLVRAATLSAILTTGIFRLPSGLGFWLPHLWPGARVLQRQNPWLIWLALGLLIVLLRLLQTGLAAPRLPGSPHPYGVALWLEQRYRWLLIPGAFWVGIAWGWPWWTSLAAYAALSFLFLPWRRRDVHRIGGKYRVFLPIPLLLTLLLVILLCLRWQDVGFLWHLGGISSGS